MGDTLLPFLKDEKPPPKNFFTHGTLPGYTEPGQLPTKKKPFSTVWGFKWLHTLEQMDILLPVELREAVQQQLASWQVDQLRYAKVMMSLGDMVEGEFFNHYVKKGNVRMLSEGRRGMDQKFELYEGVLRLELDKPSYERVGLVGKPIPDGGRKHIKSRFAIELDLRHPSMVRGKKLFDRMVYAFKNVLNQSLTWLFCDCRAEKGGEEMETDVVAPIERHHPLWNTCQPIESSNSGVKNLNLPIIPREDPESIPAFDDEEYTAALEEQLALIALDSPRIQANDTVDPYLCRYRAPSPPIAATDSVHVEKFQRNEEDPSQQITKAAAAVDLVRLRHHGFLQAESAVKMLAAVKHAMKKETAKKEMGQKQASSGQKLVDGAVGRSWFAMLAHGFADEHATVLGFTNAQSEEMHFVEWFHQKRL